jgi:hypothetical protein
MTKKITSMWHTKIALGDYDANPTEANAIKCAEAFAKDTAEFNDPETCMLLRPGPKVPAPGAELSFMRQMVKLWNEEVARVTEEVSKR